MARDIGMTREEAELKLAELWKDFKVKYQEVERIKTEVTRNVRNEEYAAADYAKVAVLREIHPIEESGVVPWIEERSMSSLRSNEEIWARRVTLRHYDHEGDGFTTVKAIVVDTPWYKVPLTYDQAIVVRDQLNEEISKWEEE